MKTKLGRERQNTRMYVNYEGLLVMDISMPIRMTAIRTSPCRNRIIILLLGTSRESVFMQQRIKLREGVSNF